jgi:hypothetical protein
MSEIFSRELIRFLPRNRRLTLILAVLELAVAYGASQILLLGDSRGLIFIVLGCASVGATIAILNDTTKRVQFRHPGSKDLLFVQLKSSQFL